MKKGDTPRLYTSNSENTSLYYARPREFLEAGHRGLQDIPDCYGRGIKGTMSTSRRKGGTAQLCKESICP
eukprot:8474228-Karenia_brevis.AAC.1